MKILFASPFFYPNFRYGGSMTAAYNTLRELSRRGHQITVLTTVIGAVSKSGREIGATNGIKVHYLNGYFEGVFFSPSLIRLLRVQSSYDIVHVNNYRNFPSDIVSMWAQRRRIPTVISANGSLLAYRQVPSFPPSRRMLYLIHDTLLSSPIKKSSIAIAVSPVEADHYLEFGVPPERIRIVPNGVELAVFSPGKPNKRLEHGLSSKLIGFVGRLDPIKGLITLLEAFQIVQKSHPECKLILVGPDFGMRKVLDSIVDAKKLDGVVFLGTVPPEHLADIYRSLDVAVTPSFFEVFGMSTLEAMACGRPVVCTRVGGTVDLIRDGRDGFLVPPGDPHALADRISTLLADASLAAELGRNAWMRAQNYSMARTADLTEQAYSDCFNS